VSIPKLQAPNPKKLPTPNPNGQCRFWNLGCWEFVGAWSLELGI
jgi:hypothetical protein